MIYNKIDLGREHKIFTQKHKINSNLENKKAVTRFSENGTLLEQRLFPYLISWWHFHLLGTQTLLVPKNANDDKREKHYNAVKHNTHTLINTRVHYSHLFWWLLHFFTIALVSLAMEKTDQCKSAFSKFRAENSKYQL